MGEHLEDHDGQGAGPFFEGSPEPSLVLDRAGRIRRVNRAFSATYGWSPEAAAGRPVSALLDAADARAVSALLADPSGEGRHEARVLAPDGRSRPGEWRVAPGPGDARFAVVRDATDLLAARRRAEAVERAAAIGSWELDPSDGTVRWSPGLYDLYGVDPAGFDPSSIDWRTVFEGPSALRFAEAAAALRHDGTPFDLELEMPDGRGRAIWVRATGLRDEAGRLHGTLRDVTAERARRRRLERLGAMARLTTNAVIVGDAEGRIEWVNRAFTHQTGYAAEEVVGRLPTFLDSPRSDPAHVAALDRAVRAGRPIRDRIPNRRRDGEEITVEVEVQPLMEDGAFAGWVAIRTDVTEEWRRERRLVRAEREAAASRAQLVAAVEVLDDAFVLYDEDDRLVVCNGRYRTLYDKSAAAMVPGARFEDILRHGLANGQYLDAIGQEEEWLARRLADHGAASKTLEQPLPEGRWLRVVERVTPDGGRVGLRVDITHMKQQEKALREALRRAEEASEVKSSFLATMSHEIRTPMNGILGLADLLAETPLDPHQGELVGDLRQTGESLLRILNDVLDFSKIEAGRVEIEAIAFDPAEIARRVEVLHGPLARDKGLALHIEAQPGPMREGDPTRLLQVLGNLVSNALKFTEEGRVSLTLANPAQGALRVDVADTGIGMTLEESARVFERFAQADTSVTRRFGGTGLGLSIVRGLVTAMGGLLEVWSVPGEGTRIGIELPLPAAAAPCAVRGPVAPGADLGGIRILAADDNAMNRRVLKGMLDRLGASHDIVDSGAEAVAAARSGAYDLHLLDISMPGMDGIEALAAIEAEAAAAGRRPAPALAVTANVLEGQVASYIDAGFAGHLPKPLRIPALDAAVKAALGRPSA